MLITKDFIETVIDHRKKHETYIEEMREDIFRVAREYCDIMRLSGYKNLFVKGDNPIGIWEDDKRIYINYWDGEDDGNFTFPIEYMYDKEWKEKLKAEMEEKQRKAKEKEAAEKQEQKEAHEAYELREYKRLKRKYEK